MRAVTVGVDAITGSAGLIWPGDRVDLILTQTIAGATTPIGRRVAAETVLSDVRVIAIDQQLVQGAEANASDDQARTVTFEVTQEQAERVSVAIRLGRLSLSVRSAEIAAAWHAASRRARTPPGRSMSHRRSAQTPRTAPAEHPAGVSRAALTQRSSSSDEDPARDSILPRCWSGLPVTALAQTRPTVRSPRSPPSDHAPLLLEAGTGRV